MTDNEADQINDEVRNYLNGPAGQGFDISDGNNDHQQFQNFIGHIAKQFPDIDDPAECAAVATASVLNRGAGNGLPAVLRENLFNLMKRFSVGNNYQNNFRVVREVPIAFGCGNWRQVLRDSSGWYDVWPEAVVALAREAIPGVDVSNRWLDEHVVSYRNLKGHSYLDQKKDADCLAMMLLYPEIRREFCANNEMRVESSGKGTRIRILERETRQIGWGGRISWSSRTHFTFPQFPGVVYATDAGENVTIKAENGQVILDVTGQEQTIQPGPPVEITLVVGQRVEILSQGRTREQIEHVESFLVTATENGMTLELAWTRYETDVPVGAKSVFTVADGNLSLFETSGRAHALSEGEKFVVNGFDEYARENVVTAEGKLQNLKVKILPAKPLTVRGEGAILFWGCTCGTNRCAERHRLSGWDPRTASLRSFVASAVKGVATRTRGAEPATTAIKTGAFSEAEYFALLSSEGSARLRLAQVEYNVCHCCQGEYEGPRCLNPVQGAGGLVPCNTVFDPSFDRRVDRKRIILVDVSPEPYRIKRSCCCTRCKNLFDLTVTDIERFQECYQCGKRLVNQPSSGGPPQAGPPSLLDVARSMDNLRGGLRDCPSCQKPVQMKFWCPICFRKERKQGDKSCLPQRGTTVWVRIFS